MLLRRLVLSASVLSLAIFAAPPAVRAADAPPAADAAAQAKAAVDEIDAAIKAKDDGALSTAIKKVPPLYKGTQDTAVRASLAKALGSCVKLQKMTSARKAALDALVETEDGKEAWKAMQGSYPSDDVEDAERFNVDFVKAVGALHPDAAIDRLLETFRKAKQLDFAAAAVTALGGYHKSKQREKVFEEIVKTSRNLVPARSASKNPSPEAQTKWATLGPAIGKALDALTGDSVGDPLEWFKRYADAKNNLKSLFKD